jgi:hypothetical protein
MKSRLHTDAHDDVDVPSWHAMVRVAHHHMLLRLYGPIQTKGRCTLCVTFQAPVATNKMT